jgi:hypothetical protein
MRPAVAAVILCSFCHAAFCQEAPAWLKDPKGFCIELAKRANKNGGSVRMGKPRFGRFTDYPSRTVAPQRPQQAVLGKYDWTDEQSFAREAKAEAAKGPDFAGGYAILTWSCGTRCANAAIASVQTGRTYSTPFVGVIGCARVTGDFDTLERHADSSLLIVRGSLEMSLGSSFDEGPCGVFYFRWVPDHLQLIGCDVESETSKAE